MSESQSKVYMQILLDTLYKKEKLLTSLHERTKKQEELLLQEDFKMEQFEVLIMDKDKYISELNLLEDGFEIVYQRVTQNYSTSKAEQVESIKEAQRIIRSITELGVKLRTLEARNKEKLISYLTGKRREFKNLKSGSIAADKYQQNMANQHQEGQSYFLDKKK